MTVYIGADHRGYNFKERIKEILLQQGYEVIDVGTDDSTVSCDYPNIAFKVATVVAKSENVRGMLVCMSGVGQAIAANKVKGAYAALCCNAQVAALSRRHNNANILVLGEKFIEASELENIIETWMTTSFEGGRHLRRVNQIKQIEQGMMELT